MRVRSVQLGGSLAGKLSSKLSSILSSDVAAATSCGWRLRRATADPCRALDRGIMSPAEFPRLAADAAGARGPRAVIVLMIHLLPAPAHRLRTPSGLNRWPKPIHVQRIEVDALSGRLTRPRMPCALQTRRTSIIAAS